MGVWGLQAPAWSPPSKVGSRAPGLFLMTPRLTRLRIAGFKSFAEPVSLDILPGLTGIVGPNGCGKSNVVEALRWAMGETSARSLRGGDMDDVIFAGTSARPSRNLAEVTITLTPADATPEAALPAPFEAEAELQVTRRIERGAGSQFRANGREFRARDIQTLYADLASGARSSGMVSQGRVSALVNARPEERRQVLEEAAGITGLHARRHEAELKLRAAEQNLARAEDLRTQLDTNREGLRRQARQAARYRNISGLIRNAEAEHLAVLHAAASASLAQACADHDAACARADEAAAEAATAGAALAEAEAALPAPREAEAAARTVLERRRLEAESLTAEAERLAAQATEAESRLLDLEADLAAALRARADAAASVDRLATEATRLGDSLERLPGDIAASRAARQAASDGAARWQIEADAAADAARTAAAQAAQARIAHADADRRAASLRALHADALRAHAAACANVITEDQIAGAATRQEAAEDALHVARSGLEAAEAARMAAAEQHAAARAAAERAQAERADAARRLNETQAQAERLRQAAEAAEAALRRLQADRIAPEQVSRAQQQAEAAESALAAAESRVEACERSASAAAAARAEAARHADATLAERHAAEQALAEAAARARALAAEAASAEARLAEAQQAGPSAQERETAELARMAAEQMMASQSAALARLQQGHQRARRALDEARTASATADAEAARLAAEADGLAHAVADDAGEGGVLAALVEVPEGLEAALGAALAQGAEAGLSDSAWRFWRMLPPASSPILPDGSVALASLVPAPPELARVLGYIALIDDAADGAGLQADLAPGVAVVNRAGACWRWDGHVTRAGAPNAASLRLLHRRRLAAARAAADCAADVARQAQSQAHAAAEDAEAAAAWEDEGRAAHAAAERARRQTRDTAETLAAQHAQSEARRAALDPSLRRLIAERDAAQSDTASRARSLEALPDPREAEAARVHAVRTADEAARAMENARAARQAARSAQAQAQLAAQRIAAAAHEIVVRIEAAAPSLARLRADWAEAQARAVEAGEVLAALPDPAQLARELAASASAEASARADEAACRTARAAAEQARDAARDATSALQGARVERGTELAGARRDLERREADMAEAQTVLDRTAAAVAALPDLTALEEAAHTARTALETARGTLAEAERRLAAIEAERARTEAGLTLASSDLAAWQERHEDAASRAAGLEQRRDSARAAYTALAAAPAGMAARAARSAEALTGAEGAHAVAQGRLTAAEQRVRALLAAQRDAEQHVGACRERAIRTEAAKAAASGSLAAVLARAADRLGEQAELPTVAEVSDAAEERARRKYERLTREREEMGPVNLRAELELDELEQRITTLETERDELGTAIAKLRGAIGHLNREGRERLTAVFTTVDAHFRTLFTRMMGGGRAHLALTGSEDPLQAGLEIYAEPPGKKLSSLQLLSGGEQALTALSLIFAVFRCTPAPISVLDEVDAPLDDANVERLCALLDDVVRETGTRFLVVTHHQLTMSRMDRLFGVTMQERGVSRLLSVDLRNAVAMVEPALQAAE